MKTPTRHLVAGLLLVSLVRCDATQPQVANTSQGQRSSTSEITMVAHGLFFAGEKAIELDEKLILSTQARWIEELSKEDPHTKQRNLIYTIVTDKVVANALYLDVLLADLERPDKANVEMIHQAARRHYLHEIKGEPAPKPGERWSKGVPEKDAGALEDNGIVVFLSITSGGEDYRKACRAAGVPVPETMFGEGWVERGEVEDEFLETGETVLWSYESEDPKGVCLALPRYPSPGAPTADVLGVICLGTDSSNACFFDNPASIDFERDVEIPFSSFVGGTDLVANGQGVCTDCHAGENPFIVHPDKAPFDALRSDTDIIPLAWHDPLVDASWPQNPGPTTALDAISSPGRCDSCHRAGAAGRFPQISTELFGYCSTVLRNAVRPTPPAGLGTMPPFGDQSLYTSHISALTALCSLPGTSGEPVETGSLPEDPGFLSPPLVIEPLYQCAHQVAVRGAVLDAEVSLYIDGMLVDTRVARNPDAILFDVPDLVAGQRVEAEQLFAGTPSGVGPAATVRDHTADYPGGLPAPEINPDLVYECASTIAVTHVPGAELTVYSNGADPVLHWTSTGYSVGHPASAPFSVGDRFSAEISLCGEVSPLSDEVEARTAPASMPTPSFDPPELFAGQELVTLTTLVPGATTELSESSAGFVGSTGSWPVTWFPNFDVAAGLGRPLAGGDTLEAKQSLCATSDPNSTPTTKDCDALPPPQITAPIVGQSWVSVVDAAPGARIRVYDGSGIEIGDGAGTVILLSRPLVDTDVLTVVQQLRECTSRTAYRIAAQRAEQ